MFSFGSATQRDAAGGCGYLLIAVLIVGGIMFGIVFGVLAFPPIGLIALIVALVRKEYRRKLTARLSMQILIATSAATTVWGLVMAFAAGHDAGRFGAGENALEWRVAGIGYLVVAALGTPIALRLIHCFRDSAEFVPQDGSDGREVISFKELVRRTWATGAREISSGLEANFGVLSSTPPVTQTPRQSTSITTSRPLRFAPYSDAGVAETIALGGMKASEVYTREDGSIVVTHLQPLLLNRIQDLLTMAGYTVSRSRIGAQQVLLVIGHQS